MASTVYKQVTIELQDGKEVVLKPLPIGRLRRFMEAWLEFENAESNDDGYSVFINCAGIGIEHEFKGVFDSLKASESERAEGKFLSAEYQEYLEDVLDLDTIYKILEISGNLKLNDPKLVEAAMAAMEEAGTN